MKKTAAVTMEIGPNLLKKWLGFSLLLILCAFAMGNTETSAATTVNPVIFFSDLDSGPSTGGEGNGGAYVTIYGQNFGASGTVTIGGVQATNIKLWGTAHFWYQMISFQVPVTAPQGATQITVTNSNGTSNAIPFTIRSGHIYFVSTTGSDSSAGSFTAPFNTIIECRNIMKPGDICYPENGVSQTKQDNYSAALNIEAAGTAADPLAIVSYPGATVTVGGPDPSGQQYGIRVPEINVSASYWTIAGLTVIGSNTSGTGMFPYGSSYWRVVANLIECPSANGDTGCFTTAEFTYLKFYGNETTKVSTSLGFVANKEQHADYIGTDSNHAEVAWNYTHDNKSCRAFQFHSSPIGGSSGMNMYDLSFHDNFVYSDPCDGVDFATVDPSQGKVEAYNNVIVHTGIGPSPQGGDSGDYSCIYFAYLTNAGPVGGGTAEVYNNTLYDCGSYPGPWNNSGAFQIEGGSALDVDIKNNIVYQLPGEPYFGVGTASTWQSNISGSNNIWYGSKSAAPTMTTGNITTNPLLVSPGASSMENFALQSSSPAIDTGMPISSAILYNNYQAWNGNPMDFNSTPRPQGPAFDIGAYEYTKTASGIVVCGDVNGDGVVNIADALLAAQAAVGLSTLTTAQLQAAEVSSSTETDPTIYDAFLIAEYAVGLITGFPNSQC